MRVLRRPPPSPRAVSPASGDRERARGLARLLRRLGHRVVVPALSRVPAGIAKPEVHLALERRAPLQAARLIAGRRAVPPPPPRPLRPSVSHPRYHPQPDLPGAPGAPPAGR